jgi:excisionase family DNA binding protein
MRQSQMHKFLTATQAAHLLGVDRSTIQRWADANRFPGTLRTAGGYRRIPAEALDSLQGNHGRGQALLYLRVADETQRPFLDLGVAHLTRYALRYQYRVVQMVQEIGSGLDGSRPELESLRAAIQSGESGYEVILVERTDRLLLLGADEFIRWAAPRVRVEIAGASCPEADVVYQREVLLDLYYPLADALALRGVTPARVEQVISKGLESMAEALGLLRSEKPASC